MTTAADGKTRISTEEFDRKFEEGEDLIPYLDLSQARMVQPQSEGNKKATSLCPLGSSMPLMNAQSILQSPAMHS